jgi:hypothetical protein
MKKIFQEKNVSETTSNVHTVIRGTPLLLEFDLKFYSPCASCIHSECRENREIGRWIGVGDAVAFALSMP